MFFLKHSLHQLIYQIDFATIALLSNCHLILAMTDLLLPHILNKKWDLFPTHLIDLSDDMLIVLQCCSTKLQSIINTDLFFTYRLNECSCKYQLKTYLVICLYW